MDRSALIRTAMALVPLTLAIILSWWRRPSRRELVGMGLAFLWSFGALTLVNMGAIRLGLWQFHATGGLLATIPVDVLVGWAVLWSFVARLTFADTTPLASAGAFFGLDLLAMPASRPLVELGGAWIWGEIVSIAFVFLPAQLLCSWTASDRRVELRAIFQATCFAILLLLVLPLAVLESVGQNWSADFSANTMLAGFGAQLLFIPALLALTAVQEFVQRGRGTPVPFDPPKRLVTSGIYAYVANPMQIGCAILMVGWGLAVFQSVWVAGTGVMCVIFSAGLASWHETTGLEQRFGAAWLSYRKAVPAWTPRLRPWFPDGEPVAELWYSEGCFKCRSLAEWLRPRIRTLRLMPAEGFEGRRLSRLTYVGSDAFEATGVAALARALEHIHLGWAFAGCFLRLPVVRPFAQLLTDAVGGGPRSIPLRRTSDGSP
jgi:protein-S-isoprenylcysteine O-methyltransferase Ste14